MLGKANVRYLYAAAFRIANVTGTSVTHYHTDGLGSTRLMTDSSGRVIFSNNYQPFGQDNGTPTGSETYKFTGKPVSITTGLYYDYQRWYDPSIGRFISQDPLAGHLSDPQSLNPYVYVDNSPTVLADPSRMDRGFGVDNRCEKLHECPTINGYESLRVGRDALIFALMVGLAVTGVGLAADAGLLPALPWILSGDVGILGPVIQDCEDCIPPVDPILPPTDPIPPVTSSVITPGIEPALAGDAVSTAEFFSNVESQEAITGIFDVGPGIPIPRTATPSSVIRAFSVNGDLHDIGLYERQGNLVERTISWEDLIT